MIIDLMFKTHSGCTRAHSLPALSTENLDGDFFIPGTVPDGAEGVWREIQAQESKPNEEFEVGGFPLDHYHSFHSPHFMFCAQTVTEQSVLVWAARAKMDYDRKAPRGSSNKIKAWVTGVCAATSLSVWWFLSKPCPEDGSKRRCFADRAAPHFLLLLLVAAED